jgi:Tfp pilus assembly protein PilF
MRAAMFMALALVVSGCAGNVSQTTAPAGESVGGTASGRGADFGTSMSPAALSLLEQGREQRLAGDFARASASLERALRIESGEPEVWLEMGRLRFDEGNYAQAEQMGRKALSLAPERSSVGKQASRLIEDAQLVQWR